MRLVGVLYGLGSGSAHLYRAGRIDVIPGRLAWTSTKQVSIPMLQPRADHGTRLSTRSDSNVGGQRTSTLPGTLPFVVMVEGREQVV
jgi:hypothetical protein